MSIDISDGGTVRVCGCPVVIEQTGEAEYLLSIPMMEERDEVPSAWINHYSGFLRLSSLYVPPPFRRLGCARALVTQALQAALRVDLPLYLDALPYADRPTDLPRLIAFYESCGLRRFAGHPTAMMYEAGDFPRPLSVKPMSSFSARAA